MSAADTAALRALPSVDALAGHPALAPWDDLPALRTRAARAVLEDARRRRRAAEPGSERAGADELATAAAAWLRARLDPGPHAVVNATGTVIHTNLGRAPLSEAARAAADAAAGYTDLELDLGTGRRASRHDHVAPLLAELCGAEDALVVTNGAAAVLLVLRALCRGGEVLVSRGEAVEIGGGFRVPEVMRESGARLVDVGTTNRTRAADYAAAVTPRTVAIMRVHPSNFRVSGFAERPDPSAVAAVARDHGLLLVEDCGSGAFADPASLHPALVGEIVLRDAVAAGADLVTASGDKLCGGPQAGLVAGRAALVARLRRHPLLRALRPDKLVVAALAATLVDHLRGDAVSSVPVLRMLALDPAVLRATAAGWAAELRRRGIDAEVDEAVSQAGGGSLPEIALPTTCVTLPDRGGRLADRLRAGAPPVVARVRDGRVWLDPRTVAPAQAAGLIDAVARAVEAAERGR